MQGSSSGTFYLSNAHDDAHDAFMTLPAYATAVFGMIEPMATSMH
jgi:hypothetical protein